MTGTPSIQAKSRASGRPGLRIDRPARRWLAVAALVSTLTFTAALAADPGTASWAGSRPASAGGPVPAPAGATPSPLYETGCCA